MTNFEVDISTEHIQQIQKEGFVIINNAIDQSLIVKARTEYLSALDFLPIHSPREKFSPDQLLSEPWRKLAIGSKTGGGEAYSQILQTTYFSENDSNYPYLTSMFKIMIRARNKLIAVSQTYGSNLDRDHFWNACRVHHYPRGGGHMAAHRDTLFPKLQEKFSIPFLQIMVTLSTRGKDFIEGGGYVEDKNGAKQFFETPDNMGAIVLFDGATVHGVDDVDLDQILDFQSKEGRIALFTNLYTNFKLS